MGKLIYFYIALLLLFTGCSNTEQENSEIEFKTVCNPVDLSYRFCLDQPSRREAADPSMVLFEGEYYLFLSKSGGYFHSTDLINWDLIKSNDLPVENYAPSAVVIDSFIYFITSGDSRIFKTTEPKSGKWQVAKADFQLTETDPMLFLDDDGRLYYYGGCSDTNPIIGVEVDRKTLDIIGSPVPLIRNNKEKFGWEVFSDYNEELDKNSNPWIEGAWMNKYNGKYYLQYAGPGTELKSYNDAVYESNSPLGPFSPAEHNPFAYKPEGFIAGAGHGSTFEDKYGNFWHIGTGTISKRHKFERRLSLFPTFFDSDGTMYAYTGFGDYPMIVPDKKITSPDELFPGWMLLSYNKKVKYSSSLEEYPAENAVDEDIRTWWSAKTGNKGEYFSVDLGEACQVFAIQVNYADQDAGLFGRNDSIYYQYTVEHSINGRKWETLIDKSQNKTEDSPNDYIQLEQPVKARYIRINNIRVPSGKFSLSDFRVFGKSSKPSPKDVSSFIIEQGTDLRTVKLIWDNIPDATGYNIRFGSEEDKLYQNYIVYDKNEIVIRSLNADKSYFFTIDSFNEGGITKGTARTTKTHYTIEFRM